MNKKKMDSNKNSKREKRRNPNRIDKPNSLDVNLFPDNFEPKILSNNPYILKLKGMLSKEEVKAVLREAKGKYKKSTIVVDGEIVYSNTRTSQTSYIADQGLRKTYNENIESIIEKVCYLTGCKRNQIEMMAVKYEKGEEYYNHHDYFEPNNVLNGGQRLGTFFCYLSSLKRDDGGETEFPKLGIKSVPRRGTALFWWNVDGNGKVIDKTLHRGNPLKTDKIKYGLNIWIREKGW